MEFDSYDEIGVEGVEIHSIRLPKEILQELMNFDDQLRKSKAIALLTPHARVLFWLSLNGSGSMNDALLASNTSYASFFSVLRRLKDGKLVASDKHETDSRVRRLSLAQSI